MNTSKTLGLGLLLVVLFVFTGVALLAGPADADAGQYGALAYSNRTHRHGASSHQPTKEKAEQVALRRCGGERDGCRIVLKLDNDCGAFAEGRRNRHYGWAKGHTKAEAKRAALKECRRVGGQRCTVRVHACTEEREVTEVAPPVEAEASDAGPAVQDPPPSTATSTDTASPDGGDTSSDNSSSTSSPDAGGTSIPSPSNASSPDAGTASPPAHGAKSHHANIAPPSNGS